MTRKEAIKEMFSKEEIEVIAQGLFESRLAIQEKMSRVSSHVINDPDNVYWSNYKKAYATNDFLSALFS